MILMHSIPLTQDHGGIVDLVRFLCGVLHKGGGKETNVDIPDRWMA